MRHALIAFAALAAAASGPAAAAESRIFVREIPDEATFATYSRVVGAERFTKFVIDVKTDEILYFDVNLYRMHVDFVFGVIYRKVATNADLPEFNRNYDADKPRFILGYLTHHLKGGEWSYSFWEGDQITAKEIRRVRARLERSFFAKGLKWRPDSPAQEKKLGELGDIPTTTNDRLYKAATYQAFHAGRAVGRLRVVPPGARVEELLFARDEIVILQKSYPDISPVAGILSTVFSTPLAHVNLRAEAWDIPNAGYKSAVAQYRALDGKTVVFEVRDVDHTLRAATAAEIEEWRRKSSSAREVRLPAADVGVTELRALSAIRAGDARIFGAKAANLGEIKASAPAGVHVPDAFGVPFAFYVAHMKTSGLALEVERILGDPRFASDAAWRRGALEELRAKIRRAPIAKKTLDAIWSKVKKDLGGRGVFVRSSTNAEDLEGFNGAGLYDTVPNVKTRAQLADALRRVWASLWNFHAVEERTVFGIDHRAVYAGALVQIGVPASAAGVLITRNLYDREDPRSFTINAKRGLGLRVVAGTTVPEQIIYDLANDGTKIISRSDDPTMLVFDEQGGVREVANPNKGVILTEARARTLSQAVEKVIPLFSTRHPLDVEWILDGEKIWIVQARPYVAK